ncbi:MAG: MFS transporter [Candidatus Thorarchaeota archaeon]|nr:MAG: MFS transporter [Candidatus Thorarchaeota archaeon]
MHEGASSRLYLNRSLQIVFSVTLMAVLGVSSITPAFPRIVQELGISTESVGLLITAFTIPGVLLTLLLGILADRFGRKKILVPGLLLFGVAGSLCFLASDFDILLVLRFFQGIGAASLGSLNVTIIGDLFSGADRNAAMGYNASVLSIGTAGYPAIGGLLATIGWNFPFLLPSFAVPIGLIVLFSLDSPEPKAPEQMTAYLRGAWHEIKNPLVIGLFFASTMTFVVLYGPYMTYIPIFLDSSFGVSSFIIGLVMSAASVITAVVSSQMPKLTRVTSTVWLVRASFILFGVSLLLVPLVTNIWTILLPVMIVGAAIGINIPSVHTLLAGQASLENRGAVMSLNGMVLRLGQSIGPVLSGALYVQWGLDLLFIIGALLALVAFILLLTILSPPRESI